MSYHIYNYSYQYNITGNLQPYNLHLVTEKSDGSALYIVDSANRNILKKLTISTQVITTISTRTNNFHIRAMWNDRLNNRIYCIDSDNTNAIHLFYVTTTTDIVTEVSTFNYDKLVHNYCAYDIFISNGIVYVLVVHEVLVADYRIEILDSTLALVDTEPFGIGTDNICPVMVSGTDCYFVAMFDTGGLTRIYLYKFDQTTLTISLLTLLYGLDTYHLPILYSMKGMAYDNIDNLYFILNKTSDSKNYLQVYTISTNTVAEISEYDICLMLDRNSLTTNPVGFNMEKGFDINLDADYKAKVYTISKGRNNLLAISQMELAVGDLIVAVTDSYLVVKKADTTVQLWQYVDFISYLTAKSVIRPKQRNFWTADLYILRTGSLGVFNIFDGMFVQVIGNLTRSGNTGDITYYNSPDPLMELPDGTIYSAIPWIDSYTIPNTCLCYLGTVNNHRKTIILTHDGGASDPSIVHNMTATVATTIELWWGSSDATHQQRIDLCSGATVAISLRIETDKYWYRNAAEANIEIVGDTPLDNTLEHFKIVLDCATDIFDLYIAGTQRLNDIAFKTAVASINAIKIYNDANAAYSQYIGAPSDVSDSNYYEGQNTVKTKEDQVIFEGYLHYSKNTNPRQCTVDSPALFDLKRKLTAASYSGRTDEIVTSALAAAAHNIVPGTMTAGAAMGTYLLKGSKALLTLLNSLGQHDGFTWGLIPDQGQSLLQYNAGTVDSLVNITENENIEKVEGTKQRAIINQVTVKGALNPVTGVPYSDTANDAESQRLYGVQPITRTLAGLASNALCLAAATSILTLNQLTPFKYTFIKGIGWEGLVLPSETLTFSYALGDTPVESGQRIVSELAFYFRAGICYWTVEDAISYTTDLELLYQEVEELSDLIEQLSAQIASYAPKIYTFAADPTANDDVNDGYKEGDMWVNSADSGLFICRHNGAAAADWKEI